MLSAGAALVVVVVVLAGVATVVSDEAPGAFDGGAGTASGWAVGVLGVAGLADLSGVAVVASGATVADTSVAAAGVEVASSAKAETMPTLNAPPKAMRVTRVVLVMWVKVVFIQTLLIYKFIAFLFYIV